jgi:DNA-binding MarR family transcriptional regulator
MQEEHSQQNTRRLSGTLARILREFSRDYDRRIAQGIQARGHPRIRLSHQVVFANIGLGRIRVTELAECAQITQQAMGKTLRELEELGYIERAVDEQDRRAKAIRLTQRGMQLVADAVEVAEEVHGEYAARIGASELAELDCRLREAARKLELDYLPPSWADEATEPP